MSFNDKKGVHIVGNLFQCQKNLKIDVHTIDNFLTKVINEANFTKLGESYHKFENDAITGVIPLAESHISFHTWPEDKYVTLDVFACNYKKNSGNADKVFKELTSFFSPLKKEVKKIER